MSLECTESNDSKGKNEMLLYLILPELYYLLTMYTRWRITLRMRVKDSKLLSWV